PDAAPRRTCSPRSAPTSRPPGAGTPRPSRSASTGTPCGTGSTGSASCSPATWTIPTTAPSSGSPCAPGSGTGPERPSGIRRVPRCGRLGLLRSPAVRPARAGGGTPPIPVDLGAAGPSERIDAPAAPRSARKRGGTQPWERGGLLGPPCPPLPGRGGTATGQHTDRRRPPPLILAVSTVPGPRTCTGERCRTGRWSHGAPRGGRRAAFEEAGAGRAGNPVSGPRAGPRKGRAVRGVAVAPRLRL